MKKFFAFVLCTATLLAAAQIPSPEQFLGYKVGTRFTPHHKIVAYFQAVATASPSTVKLQQYGSTNEGRPLLVVFVSAAQNIANLESIRTKNMERTTASGKSSGDATAIVWLSYNVHGNEPSSSEAAMLTLYALVDPSNTQTKAWLQNTVVVMDPCINPDGRDRYVNWYNSVAGTTYNPSPDAREHREPWPYGRTNHYNFDLNRDWAWQTQIETQQRLALYNQWLPHIHVDFHEQGYNDPYYFAPAAEPFHEVITPWQREAQTMIGRNHARYFDEKGWLYFTKERFDLLYPSYGDTYPIYNGAIGMTYEQGGIGAGLGVVTENGDTLTLVDRAVHHYTTGLSTIEVASKNATRLISEFEKYYRNVNSGIGDVKAYVIKMNEADTARMYALAALLQRNGIRAFSARGAGLRGLSYASLKDEAFSLSPSDMVVPAAQPKGALVKVLFEQATKLSDSATYDITAWSLPYAYGLQAYTLKTLPSDLEPYAVNKPVNVENGASPYAYVIPWTGLKTAKLAGQLLQKGVKLRFITTPFTSGGQTFNRGSVIVMRTGNTAVQNLFSLARSLANDAGVRLHPVASGFVEKGLDFGSSSVLPLKQRKVALLTGEGVSYLAAGEVWHFFEQQLNYPVTLINAADAGRLNWSNYDVVIMPDGAYRFLNDKTSADALKAWVSGGGHLIALEGGVSALSKLDWAIKAKKTDESKPDKDNYAALRRYDDREREALRDYTPGSIYKVELDNTHPLAFGYSSTYYTLKMDNSQYEFLANDGWNVGVIKKEKALSGFVGSALSERLRNNLVLGVQEVGRGTVTYFTDDVLFRSFWEAGKLLFANAVFLVGQ